jgi:hypothetical protein
MAPIRRMKRKNMHSPASLPPADISRMQYNITSKNIAIFIIFNLMQRYYYLMTSLDKNLLLLKIL